MVDPERLRGIATFSQAPEAALVDLIAASEAVTFEAGAKLMAQGESSDFALIVLDGEVSIVSERAYGAFPLATIRAPALIGEIGAMADLPRTASALASTPVRALRVPRAALLDVLRNAPDALSGVVRQLGQQIKGLNAALALYAEGFSALERGELDDDLAHDLGHLTPELQTFAEAFGRLAERIQHERRTRAEMASAALIQREMLPHDVTDPAVLDRCDVFGDMKAARDVSGDLYDILPLDADHVAICVGDACGKGVPASLFMCLTVATLRLAARERAPLEDMMAKVNALLCAQNPTSMFTTLVYGVLDLRNGDFTYVNCGHNAPVLLGADGAITRLNEGGPPLGVVPDKRWPISRLQLASGDALFLFTDGVSEAIDASGAEYGEDRLVALLTETQTREARALAKVVAADVDRFAQGVEQADDITCLALVRR